MLSPFDDFFYVPSPMYGSSSGRRQGYYPSSSLAHRRSGGNGFPLVLAYQQRPTPNYGGLLSNVLNEGFRELQQMERELGHVFHDTQEGGGRGVGTTEAGGKVEKKEDKGGYRFTCSVAGYAPEELSVELEGDELVISGEHRAAGEDQSIHRTFTRRVLMPDSIEKNSILCNIDDKGQLEVRAMPKAVEPKPAKVHIPIGFKESAEPQTVGEAKQQQHGAASDGQTASNKPPAENAGTNGGGK